jgi:hypothetical protein
MTSTSLSLFLLLGLSLLTLSPLIVWPSRWNVPGIMQVGFVLVAYVIPIAILGSQYKQGEHIFRLYALLIGFGGLSYLLGVFMGFRVSPPLFLQRQSIIVLHKSSFERMLRRRLVLLSTLVLAGMTLTFAAMGFIPLLTPNPLEAKFLRGAYKLSTLPNIGYRLFLELATIALPLCLAVWADTRKWYFGVLSALLISIFVLTLLRGSIGFGVLLLLGAYFARKHLTSTYVALSISAFVMGAGFYYLLSFVVDTYANFRRAGLAETLTAGAPDVADQVGFLARYLSDPVLTLGRTFWGGLVPGRFEWNPSVWSITVGTSADVNNLASGGLRLPGPIMAYTAFGAFSVAPIMALSGLIEGLFLRHMRNVIQTPERSYTKVMFAFLFFINVGLFASQYYRLSYTAAISVAVMIYLSYRWRCSSS